VAKAAKRRLTNKRVAGKAKTRAAKTGAAKTGAAKKSIKRPSSKRPRAKHASITAKPSARLTTTAVTIWHNPKCSTSRTVLKLIEDAGLKPDIVEYAKTPPSTAEIKKVLKESGLKPRQLLRRKELPVEDLELDDTTPDAELIEAMHRHPLLIERPVVRTAKGTRLCRPPERVQEIL
jgi:arsenate reductase (glutaredoxin)